VAVLTPVRRLAHRCQRSNGPTVGWARRPYGPKVHRQSEVQATQWPYMAMLGHAMAIEWTEGPWACSQELYVAYAIGIGPIAYKVHVP